VSTTSITSTDLLDLAVAAAGAHSRVVATSIRNCDYRTYDRDGVPDHGASCWRIGCYLINDATDSNDLNDRHTANDFGYAPDVRRAAKQRNDQRGALALIITRLDDDAFRALVDRLAGY